jgi:hypothetical protein
MPLSRIEIRRRATAFAKAWEQVSNEHAEAKSFWDGFFQVFGLDRRRVATFEHHVKKLGGTDGFVDLFWPGKLVVEHKSRGRSLEKAHGQAMDYLHGLPDHQLPRYIITSDFERLRVYDLEEKHEATIALAELPRHIELFDFISGWSAPRPLEQDPVNRRAAELMARLHDELKESGYTGHHLEHYLVRLLFCLFADDTGIFERQVFYDFIEGHTREDGTDMGPQLAWLFQLLNTPDAQRSRNLDDRWKDFHYINGKLFQEVLPMPMWHAGMRLTLLECSALDWTNISPAIFGAMFQGVMDPKQRRDLGAHYTSEQNILKLIGPLFLNELWEEFNRVKGHKTRLEQFHQKLARLRFLDPACGCGNFLVITYRELRRLELEVLKVKAGRQQVTDVEHLVNLDVDQFYGIEIEEFPAQIAQVALWLTDHQMNMQVSQAFGDYMVRIPLRKSATIRHANALRTPWQSLLPEGERYDFILGNPPFVGSKLMSAEMREDLLAVFPGVKGAGTLDFVCAWYGLAARYMETQRAEPSEVELSALSSVPAHRVGPGGAEATRCAFVSTNSITQGEQVGVLWGHLLGQGIKIHFAHRTFRWNNEAKGVAAVHCVIIGFAGFDIPKKRLFEYADDLRTVTEQSVQNINPYLVEGRDVVLHSRSKPLCKVPEIGIGNKPIDGGHYLFTAEERDAFIALEPGAEMYFRRWLGSDEFINGYERWCLWLGDVSPTQLKALPEVLKRIEAVRQTRLASKSAPTRKLADTPTRFHVENMPKGNYLIIPEVSSERRRFIPIGFEQPSTLSSNLVKVIAGASLFHFGILTSTMHNAWVRFTCGRLESRYRYSKDIVYNNFPWPEAPTETQQSAVEQAAQGVLDARAAHPGASLADLYDPLTMPPDLVKAHATLDKAVDKCYRPQPFPSDAKRVEFLFELYERFVEGEFVTR